MQTEWHALSAIAKITITIRHCTDTVSFEACFGKRYFYHCIKKISVFIWKNMASGRLVFHLKGIWNCDIMVQRANIFWFFRKMGVFFVLKWCRKFKAYLFEILIYAGFFIIFVWWRIKINIFELLRWFGNCLLVLHCEILTNSLWFPELQTIKHCNFFLLDYQLTTRMG